MEALMRLNLSNNTAGKLGLIDFPAHTAQTILVYMA